MPSKIDCSDCARRGEALRETVDTVLMQTGRNRLVVGCAVGHLCVLSSEIILDQQRQDDTHGESCDEAQVRLQVTEVIDHPGRAKSKYDAKNLDVRRRES